MSKLGMILAGLVLVLVFSCNIDSKTKENKIVAIGVEVGMRAPGFALTDLKGKTSTLKEYTGKAVLLNFFATWCPVCRQEIPALKDLGSRYKIQVVTIAVQESPDKVSKFMESAGVSHRVFINYTGSVARDYKVVGIPTNVLIDKKGIVRYYGNDLPDDNLLTSVLK